MAKKTKLQKVLGRQDYVVRPVFEKIKVYPYTKELTVLDFTK